MLRRCLVISLLLLLELALTLTIDSVRGEDIVEENEAERHCMFDEMMKKHGPVPVAVVREVPRPGQGAVESYTAARTDWAPIRIKVFTHDLNNSSKYCTTAGDVRPDFIGGNLQCKSENVLTPKKKLILENYILPGAIKLHTDRLLVQPEGDTLIVPKQLFKMCEMFTIPPDHRTSGVPNADTVIYAAAGPVLGAAALAGPCVILQSGRPFVGFLNYDPQSMTVTERSVRAAAHEIAHALGFGYDMMSRSKMISTVPGVRGKPQITVVSSAKTKEAARKHYNCHTAPGMELEDEGGYGTARSHWERRNAKDELMAGIAGAGYYTALTMSAFEDMSFYRANWGMEEPMTWGRNAGCTLLEKKCVENGVTAYPNMFCTNATPKHESTCTADRMGLGSCSLHVYTRDLPPQYRYFSNPNMGGDNDFMDFCPFIRPYSNTRCIDGNPLAMPGSRTGPNSWCVKGDALALPYTRVGDICVEVSCEEPVVKVRYAGDEKWYPCPDGGYITPSMTFSSGRIVCPRYDEVCVVDPIRRYAAQSVNSTKGEPVEKPRQQNVVSDLSIHSELFNSGLALITAIPFIF